MIDAEAKLRTWLAAQFPTAHVGTEAPAVIDGPTIRVVRSSGANVLTLDRAIVDVDCWDTTRAAARSLALQVCDAFGALAHTTVDGVAYTTVDTIMAPRWLAWDNTGIRRFAATYQPYLAAA